MNVAKKLVFVALIITGACAVKAAKTGDISGQIIDKETMGPVAYAEVIIEGNNTRLLVTANEYGYYSLKNLPTGKYQINVNHNRRSFTSGNVHIMESYTCHINLTVSDDNSLPSVVEVEQLKNSTGEENSLKMANNPDTKTAKKLYSQDTDHAKIAASGMLALVPPVLDPEN